MKRLIFTFTLFFASVFLVSCEGMDNPPPVKPPSVGTHPAESDAYRPFITYLKKQIKKIRVYHGIHSGSAKWRRRNPLCLWARSFNKCLQELTKNSDDIGLLEGKKIAESCKKKNPKSLYEGWLNKRGYRKVGDLEAELKIFENIKKELEVAYGCGYFSGKKNLAECAYVAHHTLEKEVCSWNQKIPKKEDIEKKYIEKE